MASLLSPGSFTDGAASASVALGRAGDYAKSIIDQELARRNLALNEQQNDRLATEQGWKADEINRTNQQREFLKQYDPRLGVDNRGLTADAIAAADKYEAQRRQEYAAKQARGETVQSEDDFNAELLKARHSLATSEQAQLAINKDLLAAGIDPTTAGQYAAALTAGKQSLASLQEAEQKQADARNALLKEDWERASKFGEFINKWNEVYNKGLTPFTYGGTGRNTGATTGGGKVTLDGSYTPKQDKELHDFFRENLSPSWGFQTDASVAMETFRNGLRIVNDDRASQDLPPIPFEVASAYLRSTIGSNAIGDYDVKPQTPAKFAGELAAAFGNVRDFRTFGGSGGSGIYTPERTFTNIPPEMLARMANNSYYTPSTTQALQDQLARRAFGLPDPVPAVKETPARPTVTKPATAGANSAPASGKVQAGSGTVDIEAEKQRAEALKQALAGNNTSAQAEAALDTGIQDNQVNDDTIKTPEEVLPVPISLIEQWKAGGVSKDKIDAVIAYMEAAAEAEAEVQRKLEALPNTDEMPYRARTQQAFERQALLEGLQRARNKRFKQAPPEIQRMIRQAIDVNAREFRERQAADNAAARASRKELQRSQTINELEKQLENPALSPYERSLIRSNLESLKNDPNMTRAPNERYGMWADWFRDLFPR